MGQAALAPPAGYEAHPPTRADAELLRATELQRFGAAGQIDASERELR